MSNPTSNFNWQMPTSSDLVTDLPADFEVFGQAVDTSLADLKGGTTGQILSKASNTDMDFTWVAPTTGDITGVSVTSPITGGGTSGDVTIGISSSAVVPSQTGNSGKYLTTDGTTSSWGTISAGGWTLLNSGGTALSGSTTTISSISQSYKNLHLFIENDYYTSGGLQIRINGNTAGYARWGSDFGSNFSSASDNVMLGAYGDGPTTTKKNFTYIEFPSYANTTTIKGACMQRYYYSPGAAQFQIMYQYGTYFGNTSGVTTAITSISATTGGSFSGGTMYLYGEN